MKDMVVRTWLLGLVASALAGAACGDVGELCLEGSSCEAGLALAVVDDAQPGGALGEGAWRFTLKTAYAEKTWTCAAPAEDCALEWFAPFDDDGEDGTLSVRGGADAHGLSLELIEVRGRLWSGPARVTLTVERDGEVVATQEYEPEYRETVYHDECAICQPQAGEDLVLHVPA